MRAGVPNVAALGDQLPIGAGLPGAFGTHAEPVLLGELGVGESLPQRFGRGADVANVHEC